jgi:UPF0716 protein FxsA
VLVKLFLLFIVVPLVELALLLQLAEVTGWQITLLVVIITGIVGSLLARSQGWKAYLRIQQELAAGNLPAEPMLDAVMIFVAGALLLTPGILTDLFGLSLLVPGCRSWYRRRVAAWFKARFTTRTVVRGHWQRGPDRPEIIDSYVVTDTAKRDEPDEKATEKSDSHEQN